MSNLNAVVERVRDVFASASDMKVPPYQRGFAWTEKEVGELLSDLTDSFERSEIYFLGAMVMIQLKPKARADVVDGQQRLTCLTIMLAVLRDLTRSDDEAASLHALIGHEARMWGDRTRWRLSLNHMDVDFFRQFVQTRGATLQMDEMLAAATSQSQRQLAQAVRQVHDELTDMSADDRTRFARWLTEEVSIVRVKVTEYNLGYKVFLVLNQRGIPLSDHDILKSVLFARAGFRPDEAIRNSALWHEYANRLGQEPFEDMLKQIRAIYEPRMAGEFIDSLLQAIIKRMNVSSFINEALPRFVDAYDAVMNGKTERIDFGPKAARGLEFLRLIQHESWRAPAIKFLADAPIDKEAAGQFFTSLERLAFMLQYGVKDRDARHRRYRRVLDAMEAGTVLDPNSPLQLTREEKHEFLSILRGRFSNARQRKALMVRISAALPGARPIPASADVTVEHILPKVPPKNSSWLEDWPRAKDREDLTECVGNFTLLTDRDNQDADREPFAKKMEIYFRDGAATYSLTDDLKSKTRWTPEDVLERRDRLVSYLAKEWDL